MTIKAITVYETDKGERFDTLAQAEQQQTLNHWTDTFERLLELHTSLTWDERQEVAKVLAYRKEVILAIFNQVAS